MQKQLKQLEEFHCAFNSLWQGEPAHPDEDTKQMRITLMREELDEVIEAMENEPLENIAKELGDLLYVVYGTIGAYGMHEIMERVCDEVHRSNMSKLDENGKQIMREDGRALKGPNYSPADIKRILKNKQPTTDN